MNQPIMDPRNDRSTARGTLEWLLAHARYMAQEHSRKADAARIRCEAYQVIESTIRQQIEQLDAREVRQ